MSSEVGERASERMSAAQRASKRVSEQCKRMSERRSERPSTQRVDNSHSTHCVMVHLVSVDMAIERVSYIEK